VTRGAKRRNRRKKILAQAKGFFQAKSKLYRYAKEAVDRSQKFAYVGRKLKKRDFRSLWIIRISAASRQNGLSYSRLMHGLKIAGIEINRKMLAEMAVRDPGAFRQVAEQAQIALGEPVSPRPLPPPAAAAKPPAEAKPKQKKPAAAAKPPTESAPADAEPGGKAAASPTEEQEPAGDKPAAKGKSGSASKPPDD
jgi:large subunit ribosomal protein L20